MAGGAACARAGKLTAAGVATEADFAAIDAQIKENIAAAFRLATDLELSPRMDLRRDPDAVARSADAGYGLASMSERAAGFGGRLVVESAPGAGTRVQVVVPADLRLDEELSA